MRISRFVGLFASLFTISLSAAAAADDTNPKLAVGADLLLVVPVGNIADGTGVLLGPMLRFGYRPLPPLELTARAGYLFGFDKDVGQGISNRISDLPLWVGARYFFLDPDSGPYAGAEIGGNFLRSSASVPDSVVQAAAQAVGGSAVVVTAHDTARFGFDVSAGWVLSKAVPIDLRVQLTDFNLLATSDGEKQLLGIGFSAGYTYRF